MSRVAEPWDEMQEMAHLARGEVLSPDLDDYVRCACVDGVIRGAAV